LRKRKGKMKRGRKGKLTRAPDLSKRHAFLNKGKKARKARAKRKKVHAEMRMQKLKKSVIFEWPLNEGHRPWTAEGASWEESGSKKICKKGQRDKFAGLENVA